MDLFKPQAATPKRDIFSVSRLNREVRGLLEANFPLIWLEGEISNFSVPSSGHWYFSLKDNKAQVRCAMFRNRNQRLRLRPKNGEKVLLRARISVYEPRGEYQLLAEHIEPAGQGDLQRRFEELKAKLKNEGLFDPVNKAQLPDLSLGGLKRIAVITSPSSAAVQDVISVLGRRYPLSEVVVYPVLVQGELAPREISQALQLANQRSDADIILLVRGGGSIEDLWAFNEEVVARAIADSQIPVICGVGHETDFSIADFVADRRAPTPSVAAEMVTPDQHELLTHARSLEANLHNEIAARIEGACKQLKHAQHRLQLQHPKQRLEQQAQRLDELSTRLQRSSLHRLCAFEQRFAQQQQALLRLSPERQLANKQQRLDNNQQRLQQAIAQQLNNKRQTLALASRALNVISPLQTLERGYAIALHAQSGIAIKSPSDTQQGDRLNIKLAEGQVSAIVESC